MENYTLGAVETRFADIIWDNAPLTTNEADDERADRPLRKRAQLETHHYLHSAKTVVESRNFSEGR